MGINYYRIPKGSDMIKREQKLRIRIDEMDTINPSEVSHGFRSISVGEWDFMSPWDEFVNGIKVHLGKKTAGWKFLWNWNGEKYYKTKKELYKFILNGRVIDEYGNQMDSEEFIKMALEWGQKDGFDLESYHEKHPENNLFPTLKKEEYKEGLRVSLSDDFS